MVSRKDGDEGPGCTVLKKEICKFGSHDASGQSPGYHVWPTLSNPFTAEDLALYLPDSICKLITVKPADKQGGI